MPCKGIALPIALTPLTKSTIAEIENLFRLCLMPSCYRCDASASSVLLDNSTKKQQTPSKGSVASRFMRWRSTVASANASIFTRDDHFDSSAVCAAGLSMLVAVMVGVMVPLDPVELVPALSTSMRSGVMVFKRRLSS